MISPTSHTTYPDFVIIRNSGGIHRFSVKIYQKSRDNLLHQTIKLLKCFFIIFECEVDLRAENRVEV